MSALLTLQSLRPISCLQQQHQRLLAYLPSVCDVADKHSGKQE